VHSGLKKDFQMKYSKTENHAKPSAKPKGDETAENQENLVEAETPATEEQQPETELEKVNSELVDLQKKFDQLNDTYLRSLAEFDNYRKRSLREKAELIKNGGESVLISVLTVVDDMERGLAAVKDTQDLDAVKEGMELIYTKLQSFLKQNGVSPIEANGKDFDTDHHEAITTLPAPSEELKGKVVDCVQKGYTLNDKVIRFAKVVVGE
jgi:molecular chaperone GrpE